MNCKKNKNKSDKLLTKEVIGNLFGQMEHEQKLLQLIYLCVSYRMCRDKKKRKKLLDVVIKVIKRLDKDREPTKILRLINKQLEKSEQNSLDGLKKNLNNMILIENFVLEMPFYQTLFFV